MASVRQIQRPCCNLKCIILVLMVIAGINIVSDLDLQFSPFTDTMVIQRPDEDDFLSSVENDQIPTTTPLSQSSSSEKDPFLAASSFLFSERSSEKEPYRLTPFPPLFISDSPHWLSSNLVIMGQLKDCDRHLQRVLAQLESVSCLFNSTSFILFESNSRDNTTLILQEFALRNLNCSKMAMNPLTVKQYGSMHSVDDLLAFFEHENESDFVDDLIYSMLSKVTNLDDLDLFDLHWSLHDAMSSESNFNLTAMEIEEILHSKLAAIQFVKYRDRIENHRGQIHKIILSGDDMVADELEMEREILRQIRIYDGVNEFHTDSYEESGDFYHFLKNPKTGQEKEEQKKQRQIKEMQSEFRFSFRDRLYRIERFVVYRNLLLHEAQQHSQRLGVQFDVVMLIDPDVYSIDLRTFMNEFYFYGSRHRKHGESGPSGLCVHGIGVNPWTQDTFAVVKSNGGWLHYGEDMTSTEMMQNETAYIYSNSHALFQARSFPNNSTRFEAVRSCFGGLAAYKNEENAFFASHCKYTLLRDVFWTEFNNSAPNNSVPMAMDDAPFEYSYEWWLEHRYHNKYSNRSLRELASIRYQYRKLLQVDDKRIWSVPMRGRHWYRDGDICEHIPFHFCLIDTGFEMAISTRSFLYYFENVGTLDPWRLARWNKYWEQRPRFAK